MSLLDKLPTVNRCCYCIGLKCATILIAIIGFFSLGLGAFASYSRLCDDKNTFQNISEYIAYGVLVIEVVVFVTSIMLIYGVIAHKPKTATWFMYAVLLYILIYLIYVIISLAASLTNKTCSFPYIDIITAVIRTILWVYFVAVVKSYQSVM